MSVLRFLIIDGNSILNRAFYGIKLLSTKDGRFTNGIHGFMNTLLSLKEEYSPDAIAIAFDLKAPTFRHKLYEGYKAQRRGMPEELAQQLPVLKELLTALGYATIEAEGYEADDILGTLSDKCSCECFIATGDRDSLQLVKTNVSVLLSSTKFGKPQTICYDEVKIIEEYLVEPSKLIDIKALMGDSSDNIPGVAGIGQKTASNLIARYGSIDKIYNEIDDLEVSQGIKLKLEKGKDSAFLSRELGTIYKDVPISTDVNTYFPNEIDAVKSTKILAQLEMFKLIERLNLDSIIQESDEANNSMLNKTTLLLEELTNYNNLYEKLSKNKAAYFTAEYKDGEILKMCFLVEETLIAFEVDCFEFHSFFKKFMENDMIKKYTSKVKELYTCALNYSIFPKSVLMDTLLAGYIINPNSSDYNEIILAMDNHIDIPTIKASKTMIDFYSDNSELVNAASILPNLCEKLFAVLNSNSQLELLQNIEIPLALVLASMEIAGFAVDSKGIEDFGIALSDKINEYVERIYSITGVEFNINSPKQLGEVLFEKLKLTKGRKTKNGYSTNAEVLEGLMNEHPVISLILEYRTLTKLKSTYCDGLLKVVRSDGRIHSTLNQTETRTGRISSTEPNLQNIPVRQDLGRELRKFFIANEDNVLIDADYSQIELRVLAHISDDKTMIDAFNKNDDIHAITASQVFQMPLEMVTPLMRSRAKAVNFGIVYGIGAFSLSKDIGVSVAEANKYINEYFIHYPGVADYMTRVIKKAKENGYASTLFERRRYLPELTSSNANIRAFGERVARNMPIQGTAADIIKIAMIGAYDRFKSEKLKAQIIMQVHDELIVEAPKEEAEKAKIILREEMENAVRLKVKLSVDVNVGNSWYDAKG